jgi:nitrate/nitrite transport system ATP-binding protein
MPFLQLSGVSKSFGPAEARIDVLHDIQLSLERGEILAVVGYSGSGKTTLLSLVAGLLRPDRGSVTLDGRPVTGPGPDRGVVFQNYSLLPWLTVAENIALGVDQVFADRDAAWRRQQVERHVAMVGLAHAANRRPAELSGGMRQRVSLARALAMDPQVLLLDEPLGALDALTRATLQDEIGRLCRDSGKTALLITNDPDEGIYLADRIIPLGAGPRATLGPSFNVDLARPRDRRAMNHDPRFREIRNGVVQWMLGPGARQSVTVSRKLTLPDIEPEDLDAPRPRLGGGRRPVRRGEQRRETVQIP